MEGLYDWLYVMHALIVWAGSTRQLYHILKHKRARDITLLWIGAILTSELLALPRSLTSGYWVWGLCHIISSVLVVVLLVGVIKYREKNKVKSGK